MPAEICIHPWDFYAEPRRILDGLYYVGNTNVSVHLVATKDGLILIDSAFPQTVYLTLESIRYLGFDPRDIKYILHTHAHYDHAGGTRAIVGLTGAKTFLGASDVLILEERPELFWANEYGVPFYETFAVDERLKDGDVITLGEVSIECVHVPGHTPGAMSYFFGVTANRKSLKVGLHGGPGINTLSDEYIARYNLDGSWRNDYWRSLRKLQQRNVDVFIGAHPGQSDTLDKLDSMDGDANPFIDSGAWGSYLGGLEEKFVSSFGAPEGETP